MLNRHCILTLDLQLEAIVLLLTTRLCRPSTCSNTHPLSQRMLWNAMSLDTEILYHRAASRIPVTIRSPWSTGNRSSCHQLSMRRAIM